MTVKPITFPNQFRMTIAANVFTPNKLDRSAKTPAIIVSHPMGAVKEQSANLCATKMAEQDFVAVSVDLSFWGGSDDEQRNEVSPDMYAETVSTVVDYLGQQNFVDREQIGAIGICGSGLFAISAAKIDSHMKVVTTVSMYDMGAANRGGLGKLQTVEQRKANITAASQQRWVEAKGDDVQYAY